MVIIRFIGQKLSSLEHKNTLIVRKYGQLFSQILGETLLIVTNIGRNCALTHITSAAESLWYLSGLDRLWYPMAKLVHQDSKSLDIVEL